MAISRAQMGSQLTGNKMKKPVKKKALGGMMMDKMTDGAIKAPVGIIPQLLMAQNRNRDAAVAPMPEEAATAGAGGMGPMQRPELATRGMKKGGKVRGDGVCQRGKTKGTMR
jgi:hypothetical protein